MNQTIHRVSPISLTMSELTTLLSSGGSVFEIFAGLLVLHLVYQRIRASVKVYLLISLVTEHLTQTASQCQLLSKPSTSMTSLIKRVLDFQARILERSMLLTNCLFRMGAAAVLMSSNDHDRDNAKYELLHVVRKNKAKDDRAYRCIYQDIDSDEKQGVSITKDVISVAGDMLKMNLTSLGPLVLPYLEQFQYVIRQILCKKLKIYESSSSYTPNFKTAFEHFCIHTGGRAVIQAMEMNLNLTKVDIEPSKMTLHRLGILLRHPFGTLSLTWKQKGE
ncbi:unnamed protein product [Arabidopsis arenosa]|uniref:FAE domain-containing protein n=1 Tax=Arabidopsis arenosa TaxID=38785 RepID=A0A8S2AAD8_ARAAE|nr:unnamed protein product [Arabidopsis arenosa]